MKEIIFTANGPGEIHGWTIPLTKRIREVFNDNIKVTLILLPCQFSSGFEQQVAEESKLFDKIISPKEYNKFLISKKFNSGYHPESKGVVFYTGGDSWHALKIAKYLEWMVVGYDEGTLTRKKRFDKVFTIDIDGNLMIDAAKDKKFFYSANPIGADVLNVAFFPGSRRNFLKFTVPFYIKIIKILQNRYSQLNPFFVVSEDVKYFLEQEFMDLPYPIKTSEENFGIDFAVTLIGTNTAMLSARRVPMLALFPLNKAGEVPLTGLVGLIGDIPLIGKFIKGVILRNINIEKGVYSIPNKKRGTKIVPEMVGVLREKDVADMIEKYLIDINSRNKMSDEIIDTIGKPGAALKIANELKRVM